MSTKGDIFKSTGDYWWVDVFCDLPSDTQDELAKMVETLKVGVDAFSMKRRSRTSGIGSVGALELLCKLIKKRHI